MSLYNCPKCGEEISTNVNLCPNCGFDFSQQNQNNNLDNGIINTPPSTNNNEIVMQRVCRKCGTKLSEGHFFCSKCGKKYNSSTKISKPAIAIAVIAVIIIGAFMIKVAPINFNDLYAELDDESWCQIASDGSWIKIEASSRNYAALLEISSINEELGFSSVVYDDMRDTRALDGRLYAEGKKANVNWRYDGSTLTVTYEASGNELSAAHVIWNKLSQGGEAFLGVIVSIIICSVIGYFVLKPQKDRTNK